MQEPWKKSENETGFPFYFNEYTHEKQWDHPKFINVKHVLDDCNHIKYSKYRIAFKFRALQKVLHLEDVSLDIIFEVFGKHKFGANETSLYLESYDMEAVLYDIFYAAEKRGQKKFDIDFAVELMQNFLYNVYDKERKMTIQVSATKLTLALLCVCEQYELYNLIFVLCCDHNNCVTRLRLQAFLSELVEIFIFMHEDIDFGPHLINSTIQNCFCNVPGLVGLCENKFISWLEEAPSLLSWMPIFSRIRSCEAVVHNVKCSTCKRSPLLGLKFQCIKCSKYIQCQNCFLTGCINNEHKLSHSMREFSTSKRPSKEFHFRFIKKLCGLISCSIKLNGSDNSVINNKYTSSENVCFLKSGDEGLFNNIEPWTFSQMQLHLIIKQLEEHNRELNRCIFGVYNEQEVKRHLKEHKLEVTAQIHKLKRLKQRLYSTQRKNILQSTPTIETINYAKRLEFENMLSPIIAVSGCNNNSDIHTTLLSCETDIEVASDSVPYSVNGISTWIKDQPSSSKDEINSRNSPVRELHNDLDEALEKLQQILASNFCLDDSIGTTNKNELKNAVSEVEDMLTSFIGNVESSRPGSVLIRYSRV